MPDFADSIPDRSSAVTWSDSIAAVPPGAWAVGVSGGADSVALLAMLRTRQDLRLYVAHLDHQTRGSESAADAAFVSELSKRWQLPFHTSLRSDVESEMKDLPPNRSARFRAVRMAFFRRVVEQNDLMGVLLAHHADDVAETVLHRLLRGSSARGLAGIAWRARIRGLTILRPLLKLKRCDLRTYLNSIGQVWREDASNQSDAYLRNRLRKLLSAQAQLSGQLIALSEASRRLREWIEQHQVPLEDVFVASRLQSLPHVLAMEAARRWLLARGVPPGDLTSRAIDRLITMAIDLASPPRIQFPGNIAVRRQGGRIFVPTAPQ